MLIHQERYGRAHGCVRTFSWTHWVAFGLPMPELQMCLCLFEERLVWHDERSRAALPRPIELHIPRGVPVVTDPDDRHRLKRVAIGGRREVPADILGHTRVVVYRDVSFSLSGAAGAS